MNAAKTRRFSKKIIITINPMVTLHSLFPWNGSVMSSVIAHLSHLWKSARNNKAGGNIFFKAWCMICLQSQSYQFCRAAFNYSDVQASFDKLWLDYIYKLAFGSPWRNYFNAGFICSQHTAPRNIKLAQTPPSQGSNSIHTLIQWSLGDSFLVPIEIQVRPV